MVFRHFDVNRKEMISKIVIFILNETLWTLLSFFILIFVLVFISRFRTLTDKPGSWFLTAKCLKNSLEERHFK